MNRGEQSVAIIKGKLTGDSRGFRFGLYSWRRALWLHECSGFVEMSNKDHEERRRFHRSSAGLPIHRSRTTGTRLLKYEDPDTFAAPNPDFQIGERAALSITTGSRRYFA